MYCQPSAPLPPDLFTTTIGTFAKLCFCMAFWTVRAKMSVPPPGPAVATNSIGLDGSPASAAWDSSAAAATAAILVFNIVSPPSLLAAPLGRPFVEERVHSFAEVAAHVAHQDQ